MHALLAARQRADACVVGVAGLLGSGLCGGGGRSVVGLASCLASSASGVGWPSAAASAASSATSAALQVGSELLHHLLEVGFGETAARLLGVALLVLHACVGVTAHHGRGAQPELLCFRLDEVPYLLIRQGVLAFGTSPDIGVQPCVIDNVSVIPQGEIK